MLTCAVQLCLSTARSLSPAPGRLTCLSMTTTNTNLILSLVLLISTSLASALLDRLTSSDQCTDQHISAAVDNIEECKPRPVIVKIPWPNNTNVHQVSA